MEKESIHRGKPEWGRNGSWKLKYALVLLIHPFILQLLSFCYSDVSPVWGMCTTYVPGNCGGQERVLELLRLELQTRVGAGVWNQVRRKAAGVLNCTSPAHRFWVQVSHWPAAYWLGYLAGSQTPETHSFLLSCLELQECTATVGFVS